MTRIVTPKQLANLIPLSQRSHKEVQAITSKGGRTPSPKRVIARRLHALKKKGLTDTTALQIWEAMTMPDVSAYDQYMYLKKMETMLSNDPKERAIFAKLMNEWHKMHHGEKKKEDHTHTVNIINWNDIIEKCSLEIEEDDNNKPKKISE